MIPRALEHSYQKPTSLILRKGLKKLKKDWWRLSQIFFAEMECPEMANFSQLKISMEK